MFVRFVRANKQCPVAAREGFLCAAYELHVDIHLDPHTHARLQELLCWFDHHVPVPERFNRTDSKGWYRRQTKGLSWFKPTAEHALSKSFELLHLLRDNGHVIEVIRTDRAGYIVYEDDVQIVAEPFADTPV